MAKARQRSTSFCWPCDRWKKFCMPALAAAVAEAGTGCVGEGGGLTRSSMPKRSTQPSAVARWSRETSE